MKVEHIVRRVVPERGSGFRSEARDRHVLIEGRQYDAIPLGPHCIEPGVFLQIGNALDLEPKKLMEMDKPTALDDLELQTDIHYFGARRIGLAQIDITKEVNTEKVVPAEIAQQEDDMWFDRDAQLGALDRLEEAFGRIEAEQFLGRALTLEEPLWPLGEYFDYDIFWGNTPPSLGKKIHKAGIPQRKSVTSSK